MCGRIYTELVFATSVLFYQYITIEVNITVIIFTKKKIFFSNISSEKKIQQLYSKLIKSIIV